MPELRIILLAAGAVLIVGLLAGERRKARAAARAVAAEAMPETEAPPRVPAESPAPPQVGSHSPVRASREPPQDLPVIKVSDAAEIDLSFATRPVEPAVPVHIEDDVGPVIERDADDAQWQAPAIQQHSGASLVLDWPAESERQVVALRVMPRGADRFAGRSVRQALVGEGFLHGPMEIFHLPRDDGRVLLSAAGLMRPGVFRLDSMDTERFAGINVFAVLPGALPADETFDRLVEVGRLLSARLNAELRDQRGEPLTTARVVALRAQHAGAGP